MADHKKSVPQRASFEYLRGKTLDIFPEYCKEAEDHLSKAVCEINKSFLWYFCKIVFDCLFTAS